MSLNCLNESEKHTNYNDMKGVSPNNLLSSMSSTVQNEKPSQSEEVYQIISFSGSGYLISTATRGKWDPSAPHGKFKNLNKFFSKGQR